MTRHLTIAEVLASAARHEQLRRADEHVKAEECYFQQAQIEVAEMKAKGEAPPNSGWSYILQRAQKIKQGVK